MVEGKPRGVARSSRILSGEEGDEGIWHEYHDVHDPIGSKPHTTHEIDRSIAKHKIVAISVIFVFGMEIIRGGRI